MKLHAFLSLVLLVAYANQAVSQTTGDARANAQATANGVVASGTGGSSAGGSASAISNYDYERPTPPAYAPTMPATTPCYVGLGAGVSGGAFSLSLGGYVEDTKCTEREDLRFALMSGDPELISIAKARFAKRIRKDLDGRETGRGSKASSRAVRTDPESRPFGY